jgi:hypothetical protein
MSAIAETPLTKALKEAGIEEHLFFNKELNFAFQCQSIGDPDSEFIYYWFAANKLFQVPLFLRRTEGRDAIDCHGKKFVSPSSKQSLMCTFSTQVYFPVIEIDLRVATENATSIYRTKQPENQIPTLTRSIKSDYYVGVDLDDSTDDDADDDTNDSLVKRLEKMDLFYCSFISPCQNYAIMDVFFEDSKMPSIVLFTMINGQLKQFEVKSREEMLFNGHCHSWICRADSMARRFSTPEILGNTAKIIKQISLSTFAEFVLVSLLP